MNRLKWTGMIVVALTACTDSATAPGTLIDPSPNPMGSARNGSGRGAVIQRGLLNLGFIILDERSELTSVIGLTPAELADFCLTGKTQPHLVEFFDVIRPTGAVKERWEGEDVPVLVWPFVSDDLCGLLASTEPLWQGTTDWQGTDNEVFGLGEGPGANSFGFRAHGRVTNLQTGEGLDYQAVVRVVDSPIGNFRIVVSDIKLR